MSFEKSHLQNLGMCQKIFGETETLERFLVKDQFLKNLKLSKRTPSKESATRKKVDKRLVELGWTVEEDDPDCNVFTERAKTEEQNQKFNGQEPDYVLYRSGTDTPIAIIETKRKGEDLEKALKDAKEKYAEPLDIKIVFAYDGSFMKTEHLGNGKELTVNDEPIMDFVSESELLRFVDTANVLDESAQKKEYTRVELIKVFKESNDLLRKTGLREGSERFTEFSNILFLKYLSEMEEKREKEGKGLMIDKNKRWDKIKEKSEDEIIDFVNDTVFRHIAKRYEDGQNIFQNKLSIDNGKILKTIVDKISKITLLDAESEVSGDAFEYFLKTAITLGNDLGEYFTPRHIIELMIDLTKPRVGEVIYDPACGTGGFLISCFDKLQKSMSGNDEYNLERLQKRTLYGAEITNTHKIAKMNMILRGDGHNNIVKADSLEKPVESKYDVVLSNIPYSQETDHGGNYPIETTNADVIFVLHILKSLKSGGRACVIVPQGFLFKGGVVKKARKYLLNHANVEAIISLPSGVFKPYAGVSTAVLYFVKGTPTKKIWFYHMRSDGYTLDDKRKLLDGIGDINDIKEKFKSFENVDRYCHRADLEELKDNEFNLNISRYVDTSKPEEEIDLQETCGELTKIYAEQCRLKKLVERDLTGLGMKF